MTPLLLPKVPTGNLPEHTSVVHTTAKADISSVRVAINSVKAATSNASIITRIPTSRIPL